MVNTPASVRRRSRTVSTELAMPSRSRKSLYRRTPDMMASLTMVRFHSSPISPRAMALEFSHGQAASSDGLSGAQQLCVPLAIRSGS